ncbi:MAG: hypothetical protein V1837_08225 [Candidatus Woesearchaeota archaeon]
MVDKNLLSYIRENLRRGVRVEAVRATLLKEGYNHKEIDHAIGLEAPIRPQARVVTQAKQKEAKRPKSSIKEVLGRLIGLCIKYKRFLPYAILVTMLILLVFLIMMSRIKPPTLEFLDQATQTPVRGSVFYNGVYLGTTTGTFKELPKEFCEGEGLIEVYTKLGTIAWRTNKSDCSHMSLVLNVKYAEIQEVFFYVTLQFLTEEDRKPVNGTLFIDGKEAGKIQGSYQMTKSECPQVHILNLTKIENAKVPRKHMEWQQNPAHCEDEVIRYWIPANLPVPQEILPTINVTNNTAIIMKMQQEYEKALRECSNYCPNTTNCTHKQKAEYCSSFVKDADLDANGHVGDFIANFFGEFGVCEDRVYCSQLTYCQCDQTLTFESCRPILCGEFALQRMTKEEATAALKETLQEGRCQGDERYNYQQSWWSNMQNKLNCTG